MIRINLLPEEYQRRGQDSAANIGTAGFSMRARFWRFGMLGLHVLPSSR